MIVMDRPNRTPPLWTSQDAAVAAGGLATHAFEVTGVSIDSRSVAPGDLFVALSGPNFDGHEFAVKSLEAGAAGAVVSKRPPEIGESAPLLIVPDTMEALRRLAAGARGRTDARVIAVTGSVGKTGVKEALRAACATLGQAFATQGNLNNEIGAPLTLARMPADADWAILELGMNRAGEISPLSKLSRPHVAVVTTVAPAHMEFFDGVESVADAKAEIFDGLEPGGAVVLNRDNDQFDRLRDAARRLGIERIVSFGRHENADARLADVRLYAGHSEVLAVVDGRDIDYRVSLAGAHHALNSVAVLAAIDAAGGDAASTAGALGGLRPMKGRGVRHAIRMDGGEATLIDESYNASPAAMRAALAVLAGLAAAQGGRSIAALGDMLELGDETAGFHSDLAAAVAAAGIDGVIAIGERMRALHDALPLDKRLGHVQKPDDAVRPLRRMLRPCDAVLVKGSLGVGMTRLVEALVGEEGANP